MRETSSSFSMTTQKTDAGAFCNPRAAFRNLPGIEEIRIASGDALTTIPISVAVK